MIHMFDILVLSQKETKNFHEIRNHAWRVKTGAVLGIFLYLSDRARRYTSKYHRVLLLFSPQKAHMITYFFRLLNESSCETYAQFPLNQIRGRV